MTNSLDIDVRLDCVAGEVPVTISGSGDTLRVNVTSFGDLFKISKLHRLGHSGRISVVGKMHSALKAGNLSAFFYIADRHVAALTPHYKIGIFNRLTGLGPLQLKLTGLIAALFAKAPKRP